MNRYVSGTQQKWNRKVSFSSQQDLQTMNGDTDIGFSVLVIRSKIIEAQKWSHCRSGEYNTWTKQSPHALLS